MRNTMILCSLAAALVLLVYGSGCGGVSKAQMLKMQRDGEALRLDLAETYVEKGAYDAAGPLLAREVQQHPDNARAQLLYGIVLRERGLYPQAEAALGRALALEPTYARAWDALGVLLDLMRRGDEAEVAHRHAVEFAPGAAPYWNNLGFSLYVAGDADAAVLALEQALALDPSLTVAYNNLGFAYGARGDYADAARCFRSAGGEAAALLNLAAVHEENGDLATATQLRGQAAELDPSLTEDE
jgi:Flp pilus assembly protein TadD